MSHHKFNRFNHNDGTFSSRCSCGHYTGFKETRQEREDAEIKHHDNVERIRAHLSTRDPSLVQQRDYYRLMSVEDPEESNRRLWQQLADELDRRLGGTPASEDVPLSFE